MGMQGRALRGVVVALSCCAAVAAGAVDRSQAPRWAGPVEQAFARWDSRESPGCAVGVFQNGAITYERGFGMADLEHDVRIGPDTVFYVGSLSKQFTAMAAALAIREGKLSPDDSIRKHLPEMPEYAQPVTIRHLVHHTSGLRDYNTLLSIAGRRGDEAYDNPTVLRMTARQRHLNFPPGTEYLYSNTGYTLLATIVERATGVPFAQYAEERIFSPLGMTATHYGVDASRIVRGRAHAYAPSGRGDIRLDTPRNERAGAGGVHTTVRDLLRWDENFYRPRVGDQALIEQVQTVGRLQDGTALAYAWGLTPGAYRGLRIVEHGGSLGGYRAHLTRFPDQHTSIAVLCNLATIAPSALVRQAADAVLDGTFASPREERPGAPRPALPPDASRATAPTDAGMLTGTYRSDEIDAAFTIALEGGRLVLKREFDTATSPLQPAADGTYRGRGMTFRFEPASDGRSPGFTVDAGRVRDIRFARAEEKL